MKILDEENKAGLEGIFNTTSHLEGWGSLNRMHDKINELVKTLNQKDKEITYCKNKINVLMKAVSRLTKSSRDKDTHEK